MSFTINSVCSIIKQLKALITVKIQQVQRIKNRKPKSSCQITEIHSKEGKRDGWSGRDIEFCGNYPALHRIPQELSLFLLRWGGYMAVIYWLYDFSPCGFYCRTYTHRVSDTSEANRVQCDIHENLSGCLWVDDRHFSAAKADRLLTCSEYRSALKFPRLRINLTFRFISLVNSILYTI